MRRVKEAPAVDEDERPRSNVMGAGEKVRVLWLIKGLGRGGAELLMRDAAIFADRDVFEYEVAYLLPHKDALVDDFRGAGVAVHLLPIRNEFDLRWARRLRRMLIERPVHVLHVHSPYLAAIARLIVRSLPQRVRPRMMTTLHNTWTAYPRLTRIANTATFLLDDYSLAVSNASRRSVPRPFRHRVHVLTHGIPVEAVSQDIRWRDEVRSELGVTSREFLVGTIANMRTQKGYPYLLRAARRLIDQGLPIRFVAVGAGQLEHEVKRIHHELLLGDRFILLGARPDATRVLAGCDLFVLASLWEGLPLVVMEAMALGLPVVATNVGGMSELVSDGESGVLVPSERDDALADAIARLIHEPQLRAAMSLAARQRGESFDHVRAVRATESLYRGLSNGAAPEVPSC